jgi:prevent-host-death family protein
MVKIDLFRKMEANMAEKIRVTEAKAHLSALMARVGYGGERFVIERRGRPLAALGASRTWSAWKKSAVPPLPGRWER